MPLLTWVMFLKFLDDLELLRGQEAKLSGKKFKPAIGKPYRWRDWAVQAEGLGVRLKNGRDRSPQRSGVHFNPPSDTGKHLPRPAP